MLFLLALNEWFHVLRQKTAQLPPKKLLKGVTVHASNKIYFLLLYV